MVIENGFKSTELDFLQIKYWTSLQGDFWWVLEVSKIWQNYLSVTWNLDIMHWGIFFAPFNLLKPKQQLLNITTVEEGFWLLQVPGL